MLVQRSSDKMPHWYTKIQKTKGGSSEKMNNYTGKQKFSIFGAKITFTPPPPPPKVDRNSTMFFGEHFRDRSNLALSNHLKIAILSWTANPRDGLVEDATW